MNINKISRNEMSKIQLKRLQDMVDYCINNSPFYRDKLSKAGITSGAQIECLSDISKIPYTTKDEIQKLYPKGLLAVPINKVARIHASSGTKGQPTMGYYTKKDIKVWSNCTKRVLEFNNITKNDIVQISLGYGLFTGGLGFHQGAEKLGCTVIPSSAGNSEKQLILMRDIGTNILMATPSYASYLSEVIKDSSDYNTKIKIQKVLLGAERCTLKMKQNIAKNLNCEVSENYGLTECFGPGVAGECETHNGMHILEDIFYPEIIDSETGEVLKENQMGELVFTSLCREAMPLLRYRTGDISSLIYKKCDCGRTLVRMRSPFARTDDMFVFKGVNVFPTQIEEAINKIEEVSPYYLIRLEREKYRDTAKLLIELVNNKENYSDEHLQKIANIVKENISKIAIVKMDVELLNPNTLERAVGKSKRVEDLRYNN